MGRKSKQAGGNMPLTHYERTKKFASSEYGTIRCRLAGHSQYQIGYCALSITRIGDVDNSSSNSNSNSISTTIASHTKQQQQQQQIVIAMCTPSGYLYSEQAILEYMLYKTQEIKEKKKLQEQQKQQQQQQQQQHNEQQQQQYNRVTHDQLMLLSTDNNNNVDNNNDINTNNNFIEAQKVIKKRKITNDKQIAQNDLQRTSYWLATVVQQQQKQKQHPHQQSDNNNNNTPSDDIEDRPGSPCTDQPIRRKDIWPVQLVWNDNKVVCGISQKTIQSQQAIAYWVDKTIPGTIVIESVYNDVLMIKKSTSSASAYVSTSTNDSNVVDTCTSSSSIVSKGDRNNDKTMIPKCPLTGKKIKYIRTLQKSGSSFASSGQTVQVKQYRPTIT